MAGLKRKNLVELIFATQNQNKVNEINQIVPEGIKVVSLLELGYKEELAEDFETLEENSMQKAKFVFDFFKKKCFAEDTGLEIDALNGAPGVYSARFAGEEKDMQKNMDKVLALLGDVNNRAARFKTVITYCMPNECVQFVGVLEGSIGFERRGENGFGYDPIFYLPDGRALAELSKIDKGEISHRGKAFQKLILHLKKCL